MDGHAIAKSYKKRKEEQINEAHDALEKCGAGRSQKDTGSSIRRGGYGPLVRGSAISVLISFAATGMVTRDSNLDIWGALRNV